MTSAIMKVVLEPAVGGWAHSEHTDKGREAALARELELRDTMSQFRRMSIWFSLNNGVTQCALMLASTEMGLVLGGWGIAIACVAFSITTLFFSSATVRHLGSKRTMVLALGCNYVWMITFFVSFNWLQRGWVVGSAAVFFVGGVFGGFGAGAGWTAQGTFFAASVRRHADTELQANSDEEMDEAQLSRSSTKLSGQFAVALLGIEVLFMLFVSSVMTLYTDDLKTGVNFVFFTFPVVVIASTMGMAQMVREPEPKRRKRQGSAVELMTCEKMGLLVRAYGTDLRLVLLVPFQVCIGLVAALGLIFINGNLTVEKVGPAGIGNLSAISAGVALMVTGATTVLQERCGVTKPSLMVIGALFIFAECATLLYFIHSNRSWDLLIAVYALHGVGRSVYEGVNKGLCADYFGPTAEVAFASVVLWDGVSTFVACLIFPYLLLNNSDGGILIKICMGSVVAGLLCSVMAEGVHRRLRSNDEREPLLYSTNFLASAPALT